MEKLLGEEQEKEYELSYDEHEIIAELKEPIADILNQLRAEIDRCDYNLIIGDDASGRIPTLMIARILKSLYQEKQHTPPPAYFMAGSSNLYFGEETDSKTKLVTEYLNRIKQKLEKDYSNQSPVDLKALIVTDTIASGRSIDVLMKALKRNNMSADVATIAIASQEASVTKEALETVWGGKIAYNETMTPSIYKMRGLSGVQKDGFNLFSEGVREVINNNKEDQQRINKARELAYEVADTITKEYKEKEGGN